jgi:hypothetical protein
MTQGKRVDIGEYLSKFEPSSAELAKSLRKVILEAHPEYNEVVKWGHLVYETDRKIVSIMVYKKHVNFMLWRGNELDDPENLLLGDGKEMRHVKVSSPDDMKSEYFQFLLKQANELT